ncbi:MAG: methyltransferase [Massilia sp.]|uniref:methyltransferase n=1 Tax=Massilia sp. TaxID=1882437 RepID=UPI002FC9BACE
MLTSDPDRYYSPEKAADALIRLVKRFRHRTVLDSNCGSGSLLRAMKKNSPNINCVGIDLDENAINKLQTEMPSWNLVHGDTLSSNTWQKFNILCESEIDLAVLNPPFSMGMTKGIRKTVWGNDLRCSLAMAHVLATLEFAKPRRLAAILPESWAHSGMDLPARLLIETMYEISIQGELSNSTFSGARVNCIFVVLNRRRVCLSPIIKYPSELSGQLICEIVRGGLACFKAVLCESGVAFVHSTDIRKIRDIKNFIKVKPYDKNLLSGHVILLPRVGLPKDAKAEYLRKKVQISDCVIALKFKSKQEALDAVEIILKNWVELIGLYKGTGARYITIERLKNWLIKNKL